MIIRSRDAEYLQAVMGALAAGSTEPVRYLTSTCPECQLDQTYLDNDEHAVIVDDVTGGDGLDSPVAVVIACEGYWVIDPATVGLDRENWQDWLLDGYVERALAWVRDSVADGDYPDGVPTSTADLPVNEAHEVAGVPWSDTDGGHDLLDAFYAELDERLHKGLG